MLVFLKSLLYEHGEPSRTTLLAILIAIVPLSLWIFVTLYCLLTKYNFPHYDTFTFAIMGTTTTGVSGVAGNKYINARYNSPDGVVYTKELESNLRK